MLKFLADRLVFDLFVLSPRTRLGEAADFFVYDTLKIFLLLLGIIFTVSFIRTFFPPEKIRRILGQKRRYAGNILAAVLGIITPFCTCSAIPLFLGFIEAGVPLGITFSFLIASPMINEVALVMLWGMFGWKVSLVYIGSGLLIAVVAGIVIGKLNLEGLLLKFAAEKPMGSFAGLVRFTLADRLKISRDYTLTIVRRIGLFVVIGIGLGAWIHGYVPQDFLARYAGKDNFFAVPLATLIGIPLYSNAAGIIPMVSALTEKGVGMGTALAFMMAVTGLSLPEFLILKKAMRFKLLFIFFGIVGVGIMLTGYLFNVLLK
jgi:uncharacterized membrane protein YraQ (UPF0718 family)